MNGSVPLYSWSAEAKNDAELRSRLVWDGAAFDLVMGTLAWHDAATPPPIPGAFLYPFPETGDIFSGAFDLVFEALIAGPDFQVRVARRDKGALRLALIGETDPALPGGWMTQPKAVVEKVSQTQLLIRDEGRFPFARASESFRTLDCFDKKIDTVNYYLDGTLLDWRVTKHVKRSP